MTWLLAFALGWFQTAAATPPCLRNYGKTVCGYDCQAAHGTVGCARTRAGICGISDHGVVCWDPPDSVRAHYGERTPRPMCITRMGHTKCGYRCEAHGEEVKCARTPDGICRATALGITCWDPPPSAYCADDEPLPRPRCVVLDDVPTCGYACEARNGHMGCASTPGGLCQVTPEGIVCWDPDPPPMCGALPCTTETSERSWCAPTSAR